MIMIFIAQKHYSLSESQRKLIILQALLLIQ